MEREPNNKYDKNAIQIIVHMKPIHCKTLIDYISQGLSRELAKVIDMGIEVKDSFMGIIGRYGYKETLGTLLNITV